MTVGPPELCSSSPSQAGHGKKTRGHSWPLLGVFPSVVCLSPHHAKAGLWCLLTRKGPMCIKTQHPHYTGPSACGSQCLGEWHLCWEFQNNSALPFFSVFTHNTITHPCAHFHSSSTEKLWNWSFSTLNRTRYLDHDSYSSIQKGFNQECFRIIC